MAKEAGDPQGSNACLPRSQNSALPTKKELEFLAQLATTDGGTNPYLAQDKHGVIVSIAELKNTVALDNPKLVAKRAKADDDFFKQLAGLDCIGC